MLRGRKQKGVPLNSVSEPWPTTDYHPGDVVVFPGHMVHWALPNRSNSIRLSIDIRCQPAASPRSWQAEADILELQQFRMEMKQIAAEQQVNEELFESLIVEMMSQQRRPDRSQLRQRMAELRTTR